MRESTLRRIIREEIEAIKAREIPQLLTTREAAEVLKVSPGTMANWRSFGTGPGYRTISGQVRYEAGVVAEYISSK